MLNLNWDLISKFWGTILVIIAYFIANLLLIFIRKELLKGDKTKKEISDIKIFFRVLRYILIALLLIFIILSYVGSLLGIGITAGFLTAALGWALQRPITGIAGWLMVVLIRPFEIGDRVVIGGVKGDIVDISLAYIHIDEIGGTVVSEETSGRLILIPNSKLFEVDIINYTKQDDLILDQVKFPITFKSDIDRAFKIAEASANEVLKEYFEKFEKPYIRTSFQSSGIDIVVRYNAPAQKREEISSKITQKIFSKIKDSKEVEFAYQHTEVVIKKWKRKTMLDVKCQISKPYVKSQN